MTQHSTPILTESDLSTASEAWLLRLAMLIYEHSHPTSAIKEFPDITGVSRSALANILAGRGSVGGLAWLKIERVIEIPLYQLWLNANKQEDK